MPAPIKLTTTDTFIGFLVPGSQGHDIVTSSGGYSLIYDSETYGLIMTSSDGSASYNPNPDSVGQASIAVTNFDFRAAVWTEIATTGSNGRDIWASFPGSGGSVLIAGGAGHQVDPVIAASPNGGFLIAYNNLAVSGGSLVLKFYDAVGGLVRTITTANTTAGVYSASPGVFQNIDISVDINGNYAVVWGDGSPQEIRYARYRPNGDQTTVEAQISVEGVASRHPTVTSLTEGGTLATWITVVGGEHTLVGKFIGDPEPFEIMQDIPALSGQGVAVGELKDGRIVVVAVTGEGDIVGQVLFADGTPDGVRFDVNGDPDTVNGRPTLAVLDDGRFIVGWEQDSVPGETADSLMMATFDPREEGAEISGTLYADKYVGTGWDDILVMGAGHDTARGGNGADLIVGESGDDTLFGEAGIDVLKGSGGDDRLNGGAGADRLDGGAGVDSVDYTGSLAVTINLTTGVHTGGDAAGDVLIGVEFIYGSAFADQMIGGTGSDIFRGADGNDVLTGGAGNDSLNGDGGTDTIEGGAGADNMMGDGDVITEPQDPRDRVLYLTSPSGVTVNLTTQVNEGGHAQGDGIYRIEDVVGSAHSDRLTGNAQGNQLFGEGGNDELSGMNGADVLDGGLGADTMTGGLGNDVFHVDNAGDVAVELSGGGVDLVYSSVTFNMAGQDLERITLTGTGAITAAGNALDNIMVGNDAANGLNGSAGADLMDGGGGDDKYWVDNAGDVILEAAGGGIDLVQSTISYILLSNTENLTLTGSASINGLGNASVNTIVGNVGSNIIYGAGGADTLTGGGGVDRFDYNAAADSSYALYDRIMDLGDDDIIDLSGIDANSGVAGNQAFALVDDFTGAGQVTLKLNAGAGFTVLSAYIDGDAVVDMRIVIYGDHTDFAGLVL